MGRMAHFMDVWLAATPIAVSKYYHCGEQAAFATVASQVASGLPSATTSGYLRPAATNCATSFFFLSLFFNLIGFFVISRANRDIFRQTI